MPKPKAARPEGNADGRARADLEPTGAYDATPLRSLTAAAWVVLVAFTVHLAIAAPAWSADDVPRPLLAKGQPVDWWFVFKFNASKGFAGCGADTGQRTCRFGGKVQTKPAFGQQHAFASSKSGGGSLQQGKGCAGATVTDPIGATFDQVYHGSFFYVIWNDQFYRDPQVAACKGDSCAGPWGHSKGLLAWNDAGEGFVMQVTTPAWPRSGSPRFDRRRPNKGNTLGCNASNNNVLASQHFFALTLNKDDLLVVLKALWNASVVTDPTKLQIVKNGGPKEVRELVDKLGTKPGKDDTVRVTKEELSVRATKDDASSRIILISKPSRVRVPPWQMVSSMLAGVPERVATWWASPFIPSTNKSTKIKCRDDQITTDPGPVKIALTGEWNGQVIKLNAPSNHAKIGVSTMGNEHFVILGDLNQQGTLSPPKCEKSQNGRGGLFFVLKNKDLFDSVSALIDGDTASTKAR